MCCFFMADEDKNFGGSLVLDFRKLWHHMKTIYNSSGCAKKAVISDLILIIEKP